MILLGNFQHSLDDKKRIRLPSKFREILGSTYILVPGTQGCIWLYPASSESDFIKMMNDIGEFNPHNAEAIRIIASMGSLADADSQGRFMLPQELIDFAKIDKDIRIIGAFKKVEIWSEEAYVKYRNSIGTTSADIDKIYESLDKSGKKE